MDEAAKEAKKKVTQYGVGCRKIEAVRIVDDMATIANVEKVLNVTLDTCTRELGSKHTRISTKKTKTIVQSRNTIKHIAIDGHQIERAKKLKFIGTIIYQDEKLDEQIKERRGVDGNFFNDIRSSY